MSNTLKVFNFESNEVRTLLINNEPWFVGKDVASVLGYADTKKAIKAHVDEEDRNLISYDDFKGYQNAPLENVSHFGVTVVNESGLYSLIMGSKLESAKKFKRWVTSEVLPTLRKTGQYNITDSYMIKDHIERAKRWIEEEEERQALRLENAEMKPKASYYDEVLSCKNAVSITTIAKDYNWTAQQLNKYLHDKGVQYKQGKRWFLYKEYAEKYKDDNKLTDTTTVPTTAKDGTKSAHVHMYWTQRGRLFIYDLLKSDGILQTIEEKGEQ